MKRILFLLITVTVLMLMTSVTCFATEVADAPEQHTVFTRVWEYVLRYKTELLTAAGDGLILIGLLITRKIFKNKTNDISQDLKAVKSDASGTKQQQSSVVGAINGLIDGYNEMRQSYNQYENTEDDRNKLVGALVIQNTAILEMMHTIYANSRNVPQGVKDIITLKYANTLKSLDNDEMLRSVVEAVRARVGSGTELMAIDNACEERTDI